VDKNGQIIDGTYFNVFSRNGYAKQLPYTPKEGPNVNKANLEAQNSVLKIEDEIKLKLDIPYIDAEIFDRTPNDPLDFKDVSSFDLDVKKGILSLNANDLTNTVNTLIAKETDLVKDFKLNFVPGNRVETSLQVKKSIFKLNISVGAQLHAQTVNNMIRVTPDKVNVGKIPVKKLMDFLGIELGDILKLTNTAGGIITSGDSIYLSPTKLVAQPVLGGHVTGVKTGIGSISLIMGDMSNYQPKELYGATNYLRLSGGNVNFNGFNLKDADVILKDGTPENPFDIADDPSKKIITKGQVTIPEEFISTALKQKAGSGSIKDLRFAMPEGQGKLNGKMWGWLPISLNLDFGVASSKELKVVPSKGKVLGFIPLPNSLLIDTLKKETGGVTDGNGVTVNLGDLADLQIAPLKQVLNQDRKLILQM